MAETTYNRQCSLLMGPPDSGGLVRVFCDPEDPIVLAPGVKPSGIVRVRVPRHEFAKLDGLEMEAAGAVGTLELWFSRAAGDEPDPEAPPDVALSGWTVLPRIDETHRGVAYDADGDPDPDHPVIYEQRWYLADPRWLLARRAGTVSALANPSNADGTGVRPGAPTLTAPELATAILTALGIAVAETDASLLDVPAPRDIDWRMADAAGEWAKFEAATGHVLVLRADGTYVVRRKRSGDPPTLPAASWELHSEEHAVASGAPDVAVFTSAPNRVLDGKTWTLAEFEYVGEEASGELRPLDELSYVSPDYDSWGEAIRDDFDKYGAAERVLAMGSVGRMLRLMAAYRAAYLPILAERIDAANGERLPAQVAHSGTHVTADGHARRPDGPVEVHGCQFDPRRGLVVMPHPAWLLNDGKEDADEMYEEFERFLTGEEWRLTASYESRTGAPAVDFYVVAYRRGDEGGPVEVDGAAGYLGAEEARVVRMPHWRPRRSDGVVANAAAMKAEAAALAETVLSAGPEGMRVRVYKGFHAVDCSGLISQVEWDFGALTTTVKYQAWQLPASLHEQQAALAGGAGGAAPARPGGSVERETLDRAAHESRTGAGTAAPAVRPGFGLPAVPVASAKRYRYGIAADTWTSGNEIEMVACADDEGGDPDVGTVITGEITSPTGGGDFADGVVPDISAGDVLCYLPYGDGRGHVVNCRWKLDAEAVLSAMGIEIATGRWIDVDADGTYTISDADWRGRVIGTWLAYDPNCTPGAFRQGASVEEASWAYTDTAWIGDQRAWPSMLIRSIHPGGSGLRLELDTATGHLVLIAGPGYRAAAGRTQVAVRAVATEQWTAPHITAPD